MTDDRIMLIVNPISGTGKFQKDVPENVERKLSGCGMRTDVRFTGGRGDATRFAAEAAAEGYAAVLACGGDGTVNETACALAGSSLLWGFLPRFGQRSRPYFWAFLWMWTLLWMWCFSAMWWRRTMAR